MGKTVTIYYLENRFGGMIELKIGSSEAIETAKMYRFPRLTGPRHRSVLRKDELGSEYNTSVDALLSSFIEQKKRSIGWLLERVEKERRDVVKAKVLMEENDE